MRQDEYYMLTDFGRKIGEVLVALYRSGKFLSVQELVTLSRQDESTVNNALVAFQELGEIICLADEEKWGLIPEARWMIRNMEIKMGRGI